MSKSSRCTALLVSMLGLTALGGFGRGAIAYAAAALPTSPQAYLEQAARVRQSANRAWQPGEGRLGNLRHVQIKANNCVVRLVSGTENRVFPGTQNVLVIEKSRVLDTNPNEQPPPHDVVLAPNYAQACPGVGTCGVTQTRVADEARLESGPAVCFILQIATAHDVLVGGDGLDLIVDQVRQPALRIAVNPSAKLRLWLKDIDVGLLSIKANAAVHVGGSGKVDFLQVDSSNGASKMYLHNLHAQNIGVSTTTTGTKWSIRIDPSTKAGYYQPARAVQSPERNAVPVAKLYGIEIDGPTERLDIPASRVFPVPLSDETRLAERALGIMVLNRAGLLPNIPSSDAALPSATAAALALPRSVRQLVADIAARHMPRSIQIDEIQLWKRGGRIEGTSPSAAIAHEAINLLEESGEFTNVSVGMISPRADKFFFSALVNFACEKPGAPSECLAGDLATPHRYSRAQVLSAVETLLGSTVSLRALEMTGSAITLQAVAPNGSAARDALERLGQPNKLFRVSTSSHGASESSASSIQAKLVLICPRPPKTNGICAK